MEINVLIKPNDGTTNITSVTTYFLQPKQFVAARKNTMKTSGKTSINPFSRKFIT